MKNNKNGTILNTLLALIAIVIIIFIIVWIARKNNNSALYNKTFTNNINEMEGIAKEYFANDLPEEIGETKLVPLYKMYEENLLEEELTYGKTTCNDTKSYISITKTSDNEFKVKSSLVCGSKNDTITEKIKMSKIIKDEDGNIIEDDTQNFEEETNNTVIDNTANTTINTSDSTNKTNNQNNSKSNSNSSKSNNKSSNYNIYENDNITTKDGKTPSVANTTSSYDCINCTVRRVDVNCKTKYTYEYVKRSSYCPSGYTYENGICTKTNLITTKKVEEYSEEETIIEEAKINVGKTIKKYTDALISETEGELYCPTGYTLDGSKCYKYIEATEVITTTCPEGYKKENNKCVKTIEATKEVTTSCPSGYTKSDGKCTKTTSAKESCTTKYGSWGNPTSTYTTSSKQSTYTTSTTKKVLVGTTVRGGVTYYTYSTYKRSATKSCSYSCSSGTKSGKNCIHTTNQTEDVTYTCADGYTKTSDNKCTKTTDVTTEKTYTCPSGYTKDNNNKCYTRTNPTSDKEITYYCPTGYTQEGTGLNTKCYVNEKTSDTYYCENTKATLKGNKCYYKKSSEYIKSSCPSDYSYDNEKDICYKYTKETTSPIWKVSDVIWSSSESVLGYQKTGRATYLMTCDRIMSK